MKALVADSSGVMRKIISRVLGELRIMDVEEAGDGQQALDAFGDGTGFDLVITEWDMPLMNGVELVQAIRTGGRDIPILMVTSRADRFAVVEAIQAGINDYVIKPFDRENLREKLGRLIPAA